MTSTSDRILDLIDAGLQSSDEVGYGHTDRRRDACVRCQASAPAEGGDLCPGCRAFLLEDSDEDPASASPGAGGLIEMVLDSNGDPIGPVFRVRTMSLEEQRAAVMRACDQGSAITFVGCTFEGEPIRDSVLGWGATAAVGVAWSGVSAEEAELGMVAIARAQRAASLSWSDPHP